MASSTMPSSATASLPFELLVTEYPRNEDDVDTKNLYGDSGVNGWFPMLEEYIRSIADECSRFATKHANASKQFNKYYQMITIGLIVLPLLSTAKLPINTPIYIVAFQNSFCFLSTYAITGYSLHAGVAGSFSNCVH